MQPIQYAMSKNISVLVINSGMQYARELGLTRIMQNNYEGGKYVGDELVQRGYSKPVILHISTVSETTFDTRVRNISDAIGSRPDTLAITDFINTEQSTQDIITQLTASNATYDSIISLGGDVSTLLYSLKFKS
jgi:DNA-binding LacI/PurR family transcriptional regulator